MGRLGRVLYIIAWILFLSAIFAIGHDGKLAILQAFIGVAYIIFYEIKTWN